MGTRAAVQARQPEQDRHRVLEFLINAYPLPP